MRKTEAIEQSFMALAERAPYNKITVTEICRHAHVSRKAFYERFSGKEAIIEALFRKHAIEPTMQINESLEPADLAKVATKIEELIYQGVYEHRTYYSAIARSVHGIAPHFYNAILKCLYDLNDYIMSKNDSGEMPWQSDYVRHFYSASMTAMLQKWITDGYPVAPAKIARLHYSLIAHYWKSRMLDVPMGSDEKG